MSAITLAAMLFGLELRTFSVILEWSYVTFPIIAGWTAVIACLISAGFMGEVVKVS